MPNLRPWGPPLSCSRNSSLKVKGDIGHTHNTPSALVTGGSGALLKRTQEILEVTEIQIPTAE